MSKKISRRNWISFTLSDKELNDLHKKMNKANIRIMSQFIRDAIREYKPGKK